MYVAMTEQLIELAFVAARTSELRLVTSVMVVPHRAFLARPYWRDAALMVDTRNLVPGDQDGVRRL